MALRRKMDVNSRVSALTFSPAGQLLAVVGKHRVEIHGIFDEKCITLSDGVKEIKGTFSPQDELFAFAAQDQ
jgi:hypothetical protein